MRIGIIGAGKMALWHIRAYKKISSVEIVAIANPSSDRGKKLAKKFKIAKHFSDGFDLIEKAEIDAVDICVPSALHKAFILKALRKGLHIYSEKPMCTSVPDYEEIIKANKNAQRIIFNGFNYRFMPEFVKIHSIIKSGKLGKIGYVRIFRTTKEKPASYMSGPYSSGLFNEFHCHFVDLLSYFDFGEPKEITAAGTTVHNWKINPDTATITLSYPDKMIAEITTSVASPGIAPEMLVIGTKATLKLRFGNISVVKQKESWSLLELILLMFRDSVTIPFKILKNPFNGSCRHFVECVLKNRKSDNDELSALRTFKITSAAASSTLL